MRGEQAGTMALNYTVENPISVAVAAGSSIAASCTICAEDERACFIWGDAPCLHLLCILCTVRHIRGELSLASDTRLSCPFPDCGGQISAATLAAAESYIPVDLTNAELRALGADATARARARLMRGARVRALASAALVLGDGVRNCPTATCSAVMLPEPRADGTGIRVLCSDCGTGVCGACALRWDDETLPPLSAARTHRGNLCATLLMLRSAVAEDVTAASAETARVTASAVVDEMEELGSAILTSVKQCPACGVGVSHYRGHACHHIRPGGGCPGVGGAAICGEHWCYVCCGPWPCLRCNTSCDATCDCADCPDCRIGIPCANCCGPRSCRVCSGEAARGPDVQAAWAAHCASAKAEKKRQGWSGPLRAPVSPHPERRARAQAVADARAAVRAVSSAETAGAATLAIHALTRIVLAANARENERLFSDFSAAHSVVRTFLARTPIGTSDELARAALCETTLEFFESVIETRGDVRRASERVDLLAHAGAFSAITQILARSASTPALERRSLGVFAAVLRAGMAIGADVPAEADAALDAIGGLRALVGSARRAAIARDGVVLEAALSAIAGTRINSSSRENDARDFVAPLLVAILLQSPLLTRAHAEDATGGADDTATLSATGLIPLSFSATSAAIIALARACDSAKWEKSSSASLNPSAWDEHDADVTTGSVIVGSLGRSTSDDGATSQPLIPQRGLHPAVDSLVVELTRIEQVGWADGDGLHVGLSLWEGVVVAGALQALSRVSNRAAWSPWMPLPPALRRLLARIPAPPPALAARARVLQFSPRTLRSRLATGNALRREVEEARTIAAVPLWLQILVSPIALFYLAYSGAVWTLAHGLPQLAGHTLLFFDRTLGGLRWCADGFFYCVVYPVSRTAYQYVLSPVGRVISAITRGIFEYVLFPVGRGISILARAIANGISAAIRAVGRGLRATLNAISAYVLTPIGRALHAMGTGLFNYVLAPIGRGIVATVRAVANALKAAANGIFSHVIAPISRAAIWLATFLSNGVKAALNAVYDYILAPCGRGLCYLGTALSSCFKAGCSAVYTFVLAPLGRGFSMGCEAVWMWVVAPFFKYTGRALYYLILLPLYWSTVGLRTGAQYVGLFAYQFAEVIYVRVVLNVVATAVAVRDAVWAVLSPVARAVQSFGAAVGNVVANVVRAVGSAVTSVVMAVVGAVRAVTNAVASATSAAVRTVMTSVWAALRSVRGGR